LTKLQVALINLKTTMVLKKHFSGFLGSFYSVSFIA